MVATSTRPSVRVVELTVGYGDDIVLENLNLEFRGPGLIQILGPNGAGKTTLLKAILGLIKPLRGRVYINGVDVTGSPDKAGSSVGYVPQLFVTGHNPYPVTAWEFIESSLLLHRKWPRVFATLEEKKRIEYVLEKVGLPREAWHKSLWSLSGGQRQRVLIARALIHDPEILVMDEPLSAVDPAGRVGLAGLIGELAEEKLVIVTSHDPMLLLKYTSMVLLLNRRLYMYGRPEEVLTIENARRIYGEAAIPVREHVHISDAHIHA